MYCRSMLSMSTSTISTVYSITPVADIVTQINPDPTLIIYQTFHTGTFSHLTNCLARRSRRRIASTRHGFTHIMVGISILGRVTQISAADVQWYPCDVTPPTCCVAPESSLVCRASTPLSCYAILRGSSGMPRPPRGFSGVLRSPLWPLRRAATIPTACCADHRDVFR